ncbi:bifunctional glycosyltransferase family 2/GtrA family protein [Oribacterium sp. P6A1]|uniref:bifunctional glycosyltransferase family 2/GtrA family protein n=1 Tax=Oribacterium sp. P6A1 TaxID=1410612 RepID=UPI000691CFA3|nr:bifunctional glycosyltransferase family 2/GtrA family protein [Oribacterium sp. P6A1]
MYIESALIKIAVIPAYEPDDKLIEVAAEAAASGFEVVVVDDGSAGGNAVKSGKVPAEKFRLIFEDAKLFAHVISYPENRGKGYAMKEAFRYIRDKYRYEPGYAVVVIDSDGQHRVSDAVRLVEYAAVHSGTLVLGSRKQSPSSPLRSRIGNGITRSVFRMLSGVGIYDTQTGMRAFSKELTERMLEISGDRYEYEMNMLMEFARQGLPMEELPIETIYIDNNAGSHFDPFKDSARIYGEIFKFSASSFLSFIIDYLVFLCIVALFGTSVSVVLFANVFARITSAVFNYSINRNFVFAGYDSDKTSKKAEENGKSSAIKYAALAVSILTVNSVLLYLFTTYTGADPVILKVLVEVLMFFVSFAVQRKIVFAKGTKGKKNRKTHVPEDVEIMPEERFKSAKNLSVAVK